MRSESLSMKRALGFLRLVERRIEQRGGPTKRLGGMPPVLRAWCHFPALAQLHEDLLQGFGGQVLVVILVDLHHRCIDASAEALDFHPGEHSILGDVAGFADEFAAASAGEDLRLAHWRKEGAHSWRRHRATT